MYGDEIIVNSYRTTGLTDEDKKIYEACNNFLKRNCNRNSFGKFGLTILSKKHDHTIFHYDEGVTLIIRIQPGSKGLELKSAGTNAEEVRNASKTLLGMMGLELEGTKISLKRNPLIPT